MRHAPFSDHRGWRLGRGDLAVRSSGRGKGGGIFRPDHNSLPPAESCRNHHHYSSGHTKAPSSYSPLPYGRRRRRCQGSDHCRSAARRPLALVPPELEKGGGDLRAPSPGTAADSTRWPLPRPAPGFRAAAAPAPGAARPDAAAPRHNRLRRDSASPARPPRPPSSHPAPSRTHLGHVITQCHVRRGHVPGALARRRARTKGPVGRGGRVGRVARGSQREVKAGERGRAGLRRCGKPRFTYPGAGSGQ